jgi:hypothetical protein
MKLKQARFLSNSIQVFLQLIDNAALYLYRPHFMGRTQASVIEGQFNERRNTKVLESFLWQPDALYDFIKTRHRYSTM